MNTGVISSRYARALLLLKDQGLIKLKKETLDVTRLDIVENPMGLKI